MKLPLPPCNKNVVYKHVLNHIKRLFSPSPRKERHREYHPLLKQFNSLGQEDIFLTTWQQWLWGGGDSRPNWWWLWEFLLSDWWSRKCFFMMMMMIEAGTIVQDWDCSGAVEEGICRFPGRHHWHYNAENDHCHIWRDEYVMTWHDNRQDNDCSSSKLAILVV